MQRPDFYRDNYLSMALGGGLQVSGPWQKWFRLTNGDWIGPETSELPNSYGQTCGRVYSWCPEWGLGGMSYWIDRAGTTNTCEVRNTAHGCLSGDRLTIRIAADRMTACGF